MRLRTKAVPKVKGLLRATLMLLGIAFFALLVYIRFVNPSARETAGSGFLSILLISGLGMLIAGSLIVFAGMARRVRPSIARAPALVFVMLSFCYLMLMNVFSYKINPARIVFYLVICLLVSLILNLAIYVMLGKQNAHS
jgi:hypothetical protein